HHFGAIMREIDGVVADVLAAHTRGIACPNNRTDRGAGDRNRLDPQFVERLEDGNMRIAACAAATQCQGHAFRHAAPAWRANPSAVSASGPTICARTAACSLVAVPSRTRPAMPCKIAARRKKL